MNKIADSACLRQAKCGRQAHRQSGFTLIEIMIAMFVLAVGLLGAAGRGDNCYQWKRIE